MNWAMRRAALTVVVANIVFVLAWQIAVVWQGPDYSYRVVQEALTNAVKHAPGQETLVQLDYAEDDITVRVTNEPTPEQAPIAGLGGGRGLDGLRARVAAFGGDLSAEPGADGGFEVRACLPVRVPR